MPTYEYACRKCGEHLEVVQSFNDQPITACPACGGDLRKVFGNIGIAFKGSGFYKNDSRPAPKSESAAKSDSGDTKSGDTKTKSGETKSGDTKSGDTKTKSSDSKTSSSDTKSEKSSPKAAAS